MRGHSKILFRHQMFSSVQSQTYTQSYTLFSNKDKANAKTGVFTFTKREAPQSTTEQND